LTPQRFPPIAGFMRRSLLPLLFVSLTVSAQEQSVKPGINEKFLDPSLKVEEWTERFETESREIFTQREAILKACGITEGMTIADIGAGTGLFTLPFARATGPSGKVHAVEIARKFLDHITARATAAKLPGIVPVLANPRSVNLPENSIDLAFICDVYHHFEHPADSMKSLWKAMKPGGTVLLIDFKRIPGTSSEWTLGHVRAGQDVFEKEITSAGFEKTDEVKGFLIENYFVKFRKKEAGR
jgi:ubiquinone/menaquinone biosynthesis C-methylase UbiE